MATTYTINNIAYPNTVSGFNGTGAGGTVTLTGAGTSISNGSAYTWATPNTNFVSSSGKSIMTIPHGEQTVVLEEKATLEVKGNVKINGIDLEERLKTIEKVLMIPERDATMEAKHPKLAELYKQYMHELEKYRTWDRLNGDDK